MVLVGKEANLPLQWGQDSLLTCSVLAHRAATGGGRGGGGGEGLAEGVDQLVPSIIWFWLPLALIFDGIWKKYILSSIKIKVHEILQ